MRSVILAAFFAASAAASCSSTALGNGLTCVVSASAGSTGASTGATTSAVNTTGATILIAAVPYFSTGTGIAVTDARTGCASPCNTWTKLTSYVSPSNQEIAIWYAQNPTVGAGHTVSCSGTTVYCAVAFVAVSGIATSGAFNSGTDNGANATPGATLSPGSITPPSGVQLVFSGFSAYTAGLGDAVSSGMTTVYEEVAGAAGLTWNVGISVVSQATGTAINPSWTNSACSCAGIVADIASFNTGSAPSGTNTPAHSTSF